MQHEDILSMIGLGAVGGILAPMPIYGDYLTTHGVWILSYAEWFKTAGVFYIMCLIAQMAVPHITSVINRIRKFINKKGDP